MAAACGMRDGSQGIVHAVLEFLCPAEVTYTTPVSKE
jgi:hypothetical protein